jgi:hypothetical protein
MIVETPAGELDVLERNVGEITAEVLLDADTLSELGALKALEPGTDTETELPPGPVGLDMRVDELDVWQLEKLTVPGSPLDVDRLAEDDAPETEDGVG